MFKQVLDPGRRLHLWPGIRLILAAFPSLCILCYNAGNRNLF